MNSIQLFIICGTIAGVVAILASCDQHNTREQTKQVQITHTNREHHNTLLHP
jgi:hypothetical protein